MLEQRLTRANMKSALRHVIAMASVTLVGCSAGPVRPRAQAAPTAAAGTRSENGPQKRPMTRSALADRLRAADPRDVDEMAAALIGGVRSDARLFVRASTGSNERQSSGATEVVQDLDELAIVALLEVPEHDTADAREWRTRMAAGSETLLHRKVAVRLEAMLGDTGNVDRQSGWRVCDTAYTLLAKMADFGAQDTLEDRGVFSKSSEVKRDAQIARARRSETWNQVRQGMELDDLGRTPVGGSPVDAPAQQPVDARSLLDRLAQPDDGTSWQRSAAFADQVRQSARAAVDVYLNADPETSQKAQRLLAGLEELAVVPLVERAAPSAGERQWMIRAAVEAEGELRCKVLHALEGLLRDTRPMPESNPAGPPAEQEPPRRRACDAAYLELQEMVRLGEPFDEASERQRAFLYATDAERDAFIRKARTSKGCPVPGSELLHGRARP
jgi:hypothetical protein